MQKKKKKEEEADQAKKSVHLRNGCFYDNKEKKEASLLGTYDVICGNILTLTGTQ